MNILKQRKLNMNYQFPVISDSLTIEEMKEIAQRTGGVLIHPTHSFMGLTYIKFGRKWRSAHKMLSERELKFLNHEGPNQDNHLDRHYYTYPQDISPVISANSSKSK